MLKYDFYRGRYWSSNGGFADVHCDLDLYYQGHQIYGNHNILIYEKEGKTAKIAQV